MSDDLTRDEALEQAAEARADERRARPVETRELDWHYPRDLAPGGPW